MNKGKKECEHDTFSPSVSGYVRCKCGKQFTIEEWDELVFSRIDDIIKEDTSSLT